MASHVQALARSNDELEHFASILSHDLGAPLMSISGSIQLLDERLRGKLDPEARELVGFIRDGTEQMTGMIRSLLDYARVGSQGLTLATCNCQFILERVLRRLRALVQESGAAVTHGPLPLVQADETLLAQLLQNLIENGIKYARQRPTVHVTARAEGSAWVFEVRDNGIGIEPQYFGRIFQFFRRIPAVGSQIAGAGIGLATCKRIIELHHGKIWLESKPGQGTAFYFSLPRDHSA